MDFEPVYKFKNKRYLYNKIYKTEQNKKETICELEKISNFDTKYNKDSPMSLDELIKFGNYLDEQYEQLSNNNNKYEDDYIGIPYRLINEATKIHFKAMDFENREQEEEEKFEYQATAKGNVKNEYYRSIDKITSFGIEIWQVEKDLLKFKNRHVSSLCENTCVYKFYCKRNHYKFIIEFLDDPDCEPGLLYVREVIDSRTGEHISIKCDLYCHNTRIYHLKNFLTLIESESLEDFVNKRYQKLFELFNYFEKESIDVDEGDKNQFNNPKKIIESYHYLTFRLSTSRGNCMILLPDYYETNEMIDYIFVGPRVEDYNENQKSELFRIETKDDQVKIGHNQFYCGGYKKYCFFTKFDDSKSNEDMMELIVCYLDNLEGKVGYKENDVYYTDKNLKSFLNELKEDNNSRYFDFKNFSDYYNGPIIGIVTYISSGNYYNALYHKKGEHLYDIDYPFDMYKLTFWYNKNDTECHLLVEGKYKLINQIAKKYIEGIIYDANKMGDYIEEENVFEPFELAGTFTKVFGSFKDIILELTNIFKSDIEDQNEIN